MQQKNQAARPLSMILKRFRTTGRVTPDTDREAEFAT